MMPERTRDPFERNYEQAQRSARAQLEIIFANESHLLSVRNGEKKLEDARDFKRRIDAGERLTPNQLSYIDGIYEKVFAGAGYETVACHIDRKRAGLRHPK